VKLELRISIIIIKLLARILRKQTLVIGEFGEDNSLFKESESVIRSIEEEDANPKA